MVKCIFVSHSNVLICDCLCSIVTCLFATVCVPWSRAYLRLLVFHGHVPVCVPWSLAYLRLFVFHCHVFISTFLWSMDTLLLVKVFLLVTYTYVTLAGSMGCGDLWGRWKIKTNINRTTYMCMYVCYIATVTLFIFYYILIMSKLKPF